MAREINSTEALENPISNASSSAVPLPAMKRRSILFVVTQSELGGAQQFLSRITQLLDRTKFNLILAAGPDGGHELRRAMPADVSYRMLKHLRRDPHPLADVRAIWELRQLIKHCQPDIVFLNSSKAGFVGSFAVRMWPLKPQPTVMYRIGGWTFNDPWPAYKRLGYRLLERISAPWKDIIIVNSKHDYGQARDLAIKPRRELVLIHNGINPYLDFLSREEARTELLGRAGLTQPPAFLIGTIAHLYPAKDLANFIKAMAHVSSSAHAVIIGEGALRKQLETLIQQLRLGHRVSLIGKLDSAYRYLPGLDTFVLSSRKEGFPWSVLEAMAAKVPVAVTRVGAVEDLITPERNGLVVEPGRPEQLARAIDRLLGDERLRRELAIQAHQTIINEFSIRHMVDRYERLFTAPYQKN